MHCFWRVALGHFSRLISLPSPISNLYVCKSNIGKTWVWIQNCVWLRKKSVKFFEQPNLLNWKMLECFKFVIRHFEQPNMTKLNSYLVCVYIYIWIIYKHDLEFREVHYINYLILERSLFYIYVLFSLCPIVNLCVDLFCFTFSVYFLLSI